MSETVLHVGPSTYVAIEKALGPRVEYIVLQNGDDVRYGMRICRDFVPTAVLLPDGAGVSPLDSIVNILTTGRP